MRLGASLQAIASFGLLLLLLCSSILGSPASAQNPAEPLAVAAVAPKAGEVANASASLAPSAAPPA